MELAQFWDMSRDTIELNFDQYKLIFLSMDSCNKIFLFCVGLHNNYNDKLRKHIIRCRFIFYAMMIPHLYNVLRTSIRVQNWCPDQQKDALTSKLSKKRGVIYPFLMCFQKWVFWRVYSVSAWKLLFIVGGLLRNVWK